MEYEFNRFEAKNLGFESRNSVAMLWIILLSDEFSLML